MPLESGKEMNLPIFILGAAIRTFRDKLERTSRMPDNSYNTHAHDQCTQIDITLLQNTLSKTEAGGC